ncbi:MFS gliotoxin efflux transporter GliA [Verticillium dahliae VdLs.17]|uniref:MFS gliotoxin efflux transporter GliA n=1 Tax=Verticillium dahliae (strain VdLs.17 / ATCC MYA-4575 / FGSC 10137) TaxID=498257 RepID=G2X655_VERDV|nr:MFS gliotoxin efflux transporter GliA [Verticillium dahliae VdLs.17]EGY14473.1 MFS gliotoxin efflux transporter GliA [Verticillium dahliae VdLs.17]
MDSQEKKPTPANVDTDSTQASSTDVADARVKANDEPSQATDDDQPSSVRPSQGSRTSSRASATCRGTQPPTFMTYGAAQSSGVKLYKSYDIKRTFLASMVVFEVGSLLCGVAPNSKTLVVGRAIAGLGGGALAVGGYSIVSLTVRPAKRPMMMGVLGMVYAVAGAIGPLLGGAFTDRVSWRCTRGPTHPWDSSEVIGLLVGAFVLPIVLIAWEIWLGDYASMPPRLYKMRSLWAASAFQFFFLGAYIVLLYYLPIYFQSIKGTSPIQSGVNNLPLVLAASIFSLVGGTVVMKTGYAMPVMLSGSMITTVALGLIYSMDIGTPSSKWIGYQFFVGAFMSFGIPHGLTVAQAGVGPEDLPAVTANLLFYQTIGGAFSTSAGQAGFVNQLLKELPKTAPSVNPQQVIETGASELHNVFPPDVLPGILEAYMVGIKAAFAVALAFSGVAFLFSLFVPAKKLPSHQNPQDAPVAMG